MITPNDIATKDFKKVAVGYSPEEVDTFLDDIYEDYEKLYKESQKEKSKTEAVAEDTDRLKHLEKSIERTLSLAEAAAEESGIFSFICCLRPSRRSSAHCSSF